MTRIRPACLLLLVLGTGLCQARGGTESARTVPASVRTAPEMEPSARSGHTMVTLGRDIFLFGGEVESPDFPCAPPRTVLNESWKWNYDEGSWEPLNLPAPPPPRADHAAVAWDGRMFIFGGRGRDGRDLSDIWAFDPASGAWQEMPSRGSSVPSARHGSTAVTIGDRILIFGGENADGGLWSYDPAGGNWALESVGWEAEVPSEHAAATFYGDMFLFGGRIPGTQTFSDGLWQYLADTREWTPVATGGSNPAPRAYSAAVQSGDRWWIVGGSDASGFLSEVWEYQVQPRAWSPRTELPSERARGAASRLPVAGDVWMLLFGGEDGAGTIADTRLYSPEPCVQLCWASAVPIEDQAPLRAAFSSFVPFQDCPHSAEITWDFGDGTTSRLPEDIHEYAQPGTYAWRLRSKLGTKSCTREGTVAVTGHPCAPQCRGVLSQTTGLAPLSVDYAAVLSSGGCDGSPTLAWTFGDGTTGDQPAASHTYTLPGTYVWTLRAEVDGLPCGDYGTVTVISWTPGDADGDGAVSIGEVQRAINMFLGVQEIGCGVDCNGDGAVSIGEVQKVINGFLGLAASC